MFPQRLGATTPYFPNLYGLRRYPLAQPLLRQQPPVELAVADWFLCQSEPKPLSVSIQADKRKQTTLMLLENCLFGKKGVGKEILHIAVRLYDRLNLELPIDSLIPESFRFLPCTLSH